MIHAIDTVCVQRLRVDAELSAPVEVMPFPRSADANGSSGDGLAMELYARSERLCRYELAVIFILMLSVLLGVGFALWKA